MKRSTFSDSQILFILKQHEAGASVSELANEYGVSTALMERLKELETENTRLNKLYADWLLRLTTTHKRSGFGLCFISKRSAIRS